MEKTKILVVNYGKENAYTEILEQMEIPFKETNLKEFSSENLNRFSTLFFMPGYFEWGDNLDKKERILKKIKQFVEKGGSLYIEYVQWDDYVFRNIFRIKQNHPPRPVALERIVVTDEDEITGDFSSRAILPVRNCNFLPCHTHFKTSLSFAVVRGTHKVMYGMPVRRDTWPALVKHQGIVFVTFELSRYKTLDFPLQKCWGKIVKRAFLYLLEESQKVRYEEKLFPPEIKLDKPVWAVPEGKITVTTSERTDVSATCRQKNIKTEAEKSRRVFYFTPQQEGTYTIKAVGKHGITGEEIIEIQAREKRYSKALDRIIRWYFQSGVLSEKNGRTGVYEGFRSTDHKLIPVFRSDCNTETALTILLYGRLKRNKFYENVAENIIGFLLKEKFQDLNPRHNTYGFWKFWNDYLNYPLTVYCNDNSWSAIALFNMYKYTGDKKYLKHALLTASRALDVGLEEILSMSGEKLNQEGIKKYVREEPALKKHPNPFVPSMYIHAYHFTKNRVYLNRAEKISVRLTTSAEMNILHIYKLSLLFYITGKEKYRQSLDDHIKYVKKFQTDCGGVKNPYPNVKKARELYGISEVDVTHKTSDTVVDQLYVNAPLVFSLYTAYKATGTKMYKDFFLQVMDFLVRIQIQSKDKRLNGAWMRAFDYGNWDYHGSNGDIDWGPYCIESGWSNTWIAKTLAFYLMDEMVI